MFSTPLLTASAPPLSGGARESIDYVSFHLTKGGKRGDISPSPLISSPHPPLIMMVRRGILQPTISLQKEIRLEFLRQSFPYKKRQRHKILIVSAFQL